MRSVEFSDGETLLFEETDNGLWRRNWQRLWKQEGHFWGNYKYPAEKALKYSSGVANKKQIQGHFKVEPM